MYSYTVEDIFELDAYTHSTTHISSIAFKYVFKFLSGGKN